MTGASFHPVPVAIGLGSNLGDREENLRAGIGALRANPGVRLIAVSRLVETDPAGGPPQPRFLNATALAETGLAPRVLLEFLHAVERERGRVRGVRFGPRTLDLDLLLYGDAAIAEPDLEVPHPRLLERPFALALLAEIAPDLRHPLLGRTVGDLARERFPEWRGPQMPAAARSLG